MEATDKRAELTELIAAIAQHKRDLVTICNRALGALENERERLLPAALDEHESKQNRTVQKIRYTTATTTGRMPALGERPKLPKGKRACGVCGIPGHRRGSPACKG